MEETVDTGGATDGLSVNSSAARVKDEELATEAATSLDIAYRTGLVVCCYYMSCT